MKNHIAYVYQSLPLSTTLTLVNNQQIIDSLYKKGIASPPDPFRGSTYNLQLISATLTKGSGLQEYHTHANTTHTYINTYLVLVLLKACSFQGPVERHTINLSTHNTNSTV